MNALPIALLFLVTGITGVHASDCKKSYQDCMNICADNILSERCMLSCQIARNFCSKSGWSGQASEQRFTASNKPAPLRRETWGQAPNPD